MTATALPIVFFLMIFLCMASSLAFLVLMAIWLYRDAKLHGQDPVLWVLICIFASPILALILCQPHSGAHPLSGLWPQENSAALPKLPSAHSPHRPILRALRRGQ